MSSWLIVRHELGPRATPIPARSVSIVSVLVLILATLSI
jgi:hypothetical protein